MQITYCGAIALSAPPIGLRKTTVFIQVPRVECRKCKRVRTINIPGVVPGKNHTKSFVRLVVDLRKMMTIKDIARYLGVSTTMIRSIDKQYLKTHFAKPKLKHVKLIAIDEISIGSGHKYITIVMDLESGAIIFSGKGKGQNAFIAPTLYYINITPCLETRQQYFNRASTKTLLA